MSDNARGDQRDDAWWTALVGSLLHPVQAQIIEALRRSEEPLSAGDLFEVCGKRPPWLAFVHHLRRLDTLGEIEPDGVLRDVSPFEVRYRLTKQPGRDRSTGG